MKKLLTLFCTLLFLQSFSRFPSANESGEALTNGKRMLIKAISVVVNAESQKKNPVRKLFVPASGNDCR